MNNTALQASPAPNFSAQNRQIPHRKPLPTHQQQQQQQQQPPNRAFRPSERIQPLTKIRPNETSAGSPASKQQRPTSHNHNRTTSSNTLPPSSFSPPPQQQQQSPPSANSTSNMYQQNYSYPSQGTRRTLSNATTSTTSTSGGRKDSTSASTLQRTTSSRSGTSSTSYVALMRKQKATVWSDRAQHEDPRLVAQQRAAKMRAAMEVNTNPNSSARVSTSGNSSITGGMRAKIRHHGAPKAQQYNPSHMTVSGVPMRLSAREVDDDENDEEHLAANRFHHRSSSGRSSLGSAGRTSSVYGPGQSGMATRGSSEGNTPPQSVAPGAHAETQQQQQRHRADTEGSTGAEPTPVPDDFRGPDYFSPRTKSKGQTPGSSHSEQENGFGNPGELPHRVRDVKEFESNDDLQRRGSVDERTMTMRGYGKLFVANPDLDD